MKNKSNVGRILLIVLLIFILIIGIIANYTRGGIGNILISIAIMLPICAVAWFIGTWIVFVILSLAAAISIPIYNYIVGEESERIEYKQGSEIVFFPVTAFLVYSAIVYFLYNGAFLR